jgi:hypothetical protein
MPAASSDLARSISSPGSPYNAAMPRELVWIDQPHIHGWDAYNVRGLQPSGSAYRPPGKSQFGKQSRSSLHFALELNPPLEITSWRIYYLQDNHRSLTI